MPKSHIMVGTELIEVEKDSSYKLADVWKMKKSGNWPLIDPTNFKLKNETPSGDQVFQVGHGQRDITHFENFYGNWKTNNLRLYRGMFGSHYKWPNLIAGSVVSEGIADAPKATMPDRTAANYVATRWLPFSDEIGGPQGAAIGSLNREFQTEQFFKELKIPVGIVVQVTGLIGAGTHFKVAYLTPAEQVVRGPLNASEFTPYQVAFWDKGKDPVFQPWYAGMEISKLFPTRPHISSSSLDLLKQWYFTVGAPWV